MFPHTITIYHHSVIDGSDAYSRTVLTGVYIHSTAKQNAIGKGVERDDAFNVIVSSENAKDYGQKWDCAVGDRIVKGEGPIINAWKELKADVWKVKRIECNLADSDLDNIVLVG